MYLTKALWVESVLSVHVSDGVGQNQSCFFVSRKLSLRWIEFVSPSMELPEDLIAQMDRRIERYPQKRSAVLPLLHLIQEHFGSVSEEAMRWVAQRLELKPIDVYELVTFYPMLRQSPKGRVHVRVCRTLSCALNGSAQVCQQLRQALDCPEGAPHSPDGQFSVEFFECLASCHTAPVVQVNETLHDCITEDKVPDFVQTLRTLAAQEDAQPS